MSDQPVKKRRPQLFQAGYEQHLRPLSIEMSVAHNREQTSPFVLWPSLCVPVIIVLMSMAAIGSSQRSYSHSKRQSYTLHERTMNEHSTRKLGFNLAAAPTSSLLYSLNWHVQRVLLRLLSLFFLSLSFPPPSLRSSSLGFVHELCTSRFALNALQTY